MNLRRTLSGVSSSLVKQHLQTSPSTSIRPAVEFADHTWLSTYSLPASSRSYLTMATTTTATEHEPSSTRTTNSSTTSSRRESIVSSTDSSATVTGSNGLDDKHGGTDGTIPPGEVIQAEIARAREIPKTLLTSLGAWWNSSEQTARDSETRLLK